jgi:hypothetical protein
MRIEIARLMRTAICSVAFGACMAGCGGSLGENATSGAMPESATSGSAAAQQLPWMSPIKARGRDLLYVSERYAGVTNVYTYPEGNFRGSLTYPGSAFTGGLCSNKGGDVFITTEYAIYEYPHGRASPVATLGNAFGFTNGCSVDPTTGDLAAMSPTSGIAIYRPDHRHRWHLPRLFAISNVSFGGYDARGDLFIDGRTHGGASLFKELPKGSSNFENITLNRRLSAPGNIEWDGRYLAVGDEQGLLIRRFAISGTRGRQVGTVKLAGAHEGGQFWIQGDTVIGPAFKGSWFAGFWRYPSGGRAYKTIAESSAYGTTISTVRQ